MLGTIIVFVVGGVAGFAYARWLAANSITEDVPEASPVEAPLPVDPAVPIVAVRATPNKKARKAGLTEADFTPSDDILERLRLAEAGRLDPTVLEADAAPADAETDADADTDARTDTEADAGSGPDEPTAKPGAPERRPEASVSDPEALAEAERRVLERLRRMAGSESEGAED